VGIHGAVSRCTESGEVVLRRERMARLDALACYTSHAATAGFEEKRKGSITAGKKADLVVLSDDPLEGDAGRLKDIRVEMTILDGEVVWSRPSLK